MECEGKGGGRDGIVRGQQGSRVDAVGLCARGSGLGWVEGACGDAYGGVRVPNGRVCGRKWWVCKDGQKKQANAARKMCVM